MKKRNWNLLVFVAAVFSLDELRLAANVSDPTCAEWGTATLDSYITDGGRILMYDPLLYNINHVSSGKMLFRYLENA